MFVGKRPEAAKADGRGQNAYCLVGSVTGGKTRPQNDLQTEAMRLIQQAINERSGPGYSIPSWNDRSTTTQKDVISVVEDALKVAKQRGL